MKQFIYLDTDIVNSIIAQRQKGIVVQQTIENEEGASSTKSREGKASVEGRMSSGLLKLFDITGSAEGGLNATDISSSSARNVVEKILHDAAFDIAYDCIKPHIIETGNQEYDEEGNYILIRRVFDFVDLDYFDELFSEDGLISFIRDEEEKAIRERVDAIKTGNREQMRENKKERDKSVNALIKENNSKYDEGTKAIKALRSIIPYTRMLISYDGYLVPLEDEYFRINPRNLGFKYGGEISCVGMITNIIGEDADPCDANNIFATLQHYASEALRSILPTREKNLCVIHPIAIYYDV